MNERIFWGIIAFAGAAMPLIGLIIGLIRYKKSGEKIKEKVREDYERAQEKGGISSMYYKQEGRRVFQLTAGIPIAAGLIVGLALLGLAFYNL